MGFAMLRNLDPQKLIYWAGQLARWALPLRPYYDCGRSPRCPCPSVQQCKSQVSGVAIGDDINMKINTNYHT